MSKSNSQNLQLVLASKKDLIFPYMLMNLVDDHNVDYDINITTTNIEFGVLEEDREDSIVELGPDNILVSIPFLPENVPVSRLLKTVRYANNLSIKHPNDLVYLAHFDDRMSNHTTVETFSDNFIIAYVARASSLTELSNIAKRILNAVKI